VKILASRRFPGPAWDELADVEYYDGGPLAGPRPDVEALVVVGEVIDARTLALFPSLRLVANYGVGYDDIDVGACAAAGVSVTNTPGVLDAATADLTLALILATRRRVVESDSFVRAGRWGADWASTTLLAQEVSGATLGIVGLGRIGTAVARRARGFDVRLLYTQRARVVEAEERELAAEFRALDDLLREADIVTLHVPLTTETDGLLDERRLGLLRDGSCLVNTARGAIVDEDALVRELAAGRIRAGLDVFTHEPNVPPELLELPNVVLTPHLGSATQETREAMTRVLVDNLEAAAAGRELPNPVYPS
jgi:lactate dehydrogenase-like 2-hydroxyacid dehydrogenase